MGEAQQAMEVNNNKKQMVVVNWQQTKLLRACIQPVVT